MNLLHSLNNDSFPTDTLIFKKYKLLKLIGKGSFGKVYSIQNIYNRETFAMKTESLKTVDKILESEAFYLLSLQGFGIPKFITYGHNQTHNILIQELLDKSLDYIYIKNNYKCKLTDACLIAIQLIERFEWIHSKNIVYRDIKPENFLLGKKDPNVIYVIDFGLCKKYRSSKTGKHLLPKRTGKFNGTMKYASINALLGKEQSRRDDLIALIYMIIFFIKKKLPWKYEAKYYDCHKYLQLLADKRSNGNGSLFKDLPKEFEEYFKYNMNLKFEQKPNYEYLKSLFKGILFRMNLDIRNICFNWINNKNKKLIGYLPNHRKRSSKSHERILKLLRENSSKKLIEGKSQDNLLNKNKLENINNITISSYKAKSPDNFQPHKIDNTRAKIINKNKIIKLDILNQKLNGKNDINEIYNIKNNSSIRGIKNKIIKFDKIKLDQLRQNNITNITNKTNNKSRVINFNKQNILNKKNRLKIINLNKEEISPNRKMNLTILTELGHQNHIPLSSREVDSYIKERKNNINIPNYITIFKTNNNVLYNADMIKRNRSSGNRNTIERQDFNSIKNNSTNNHKTINKNLIYKPMAQNVGIMIINNYKNRHDNRNKAILINQDNSFLKYNSKLQNHSNIKKMFLRQNKYI